MPASSRGIRFFDAAAQVTGPSALGLLDGERSIWKLVRAGRVGKDVWRYLDDLNAWLLACNVEVARRLLFDWTDLRSPLVAGGPALTPLAFDEAMVVFEQRAVEFHLDRHAVASATRRRIDLLLRAGGSGWLSRRAGIDADLHAALRLHRATSRRRVSFFAIDTRIAIGWHLVRRLHFEAVPS